jgi:hypothetical protein
MRRYRSVGGTLALAALAACSGGGPAHPAGWSPVPGAAATWSTMSPAGAESYSYLSRASSDALQDLASEQAVDTVQKYRGSRLLRSIPFPACPGGGGRAAPSLHRGEAGLAEYSLPGGRLLELAFAVINGKAVTPEYLRPGSVAEAPAAATALRQAVCFSL